MNEERYTAAIEIGSSKIVAVVGRPRGNGRIEIVAADMERCMECVRYGIIQNIEETSMRIARILERLERHPAITPRKITKVFVGLSGRSLRSLTTEVRMALPDETEVNDDILARLRDQALATAVDSSLEVVDAIPRIYTVGKQETSSPKGMIGNQITAIFDLIVCRPELKRNLNRMLSDKLGVKAVGYVVTALASARVVLKPEEMRMGCMLIDMGAETTTATIYKNGHLAYFATLPLGGRNITRDITSLGHLLEESAEEIKMSGNALPRPVPSTVNVNGVSMAEVSNLIVARAEEIGVNIVQQIYNAALKEKDLPAGIVCIGGGSKLNGMSDLLKQLTGLTVRRGELPQYIHVDETRCPESDLIEVASILYAGSEAYPENCLEAAVHEDLPATGTPNEEIEDDRDNDRGNHRRGGRDHGQGRRKFFGKISERLASMFSGPGEDTSDIIE